MYYLEINYFEIHISEYPRPYFILQRISYDGSLPKPAYGPYC